MAKIIAKGKDGQDSDVRIEGRMDDAAVLAVELVTYLGAQIRATLKAGGLTEFEPAGEPENNFALAMVHMGRAVRERQERYAAGGVVEDTGPTTH